MGRGRVDLGQERIPCRSEEVKTQVIWVGDDLGLGVQVVGGGYRHGVRIGGERPC